MNTPRDDAYAAKVRDWILSGLVMLCIMVVTVNVMDAIVSALVEALVR